MKTRILNLDDVGRIVIVGILILMAVMILVKVVGCKPEPEPTGAEIFDFEQVANRIDSIEAGLIADNTIPTGPNGEPVPMSYATTIVDPESFTELTSISADGSNFGLISRRSGLWRYIKGDTLKTWIEGFAGGGGGTSLTVEEADGSPTVGSVSTIQFNQADGFSVTDEGSGQVQVDLGTIWTAAGESGTFTVEAGETVNFFGGGSGDILVTASAGNVSFDFSNSVEFPGTGAIRLPDGTTAERPGTPANGMLRYNNTTNKFEAYENSAWTDMIGGGGGALLDSVFVTINIEDRGTTLPGTAGSTVGQGFFTVPAYLNGWNISYVGYAVASAPSGGTYTCQLNKNGATNVFSASIAAGARYAETSGSYGISTGDYFTVTLPTNSAATTEPDGMILHLILTR